MSTWHCDGGSEVQICDRCRESCFDFRQENGERICIACVTGERDSARAETRQLREALEAAARSLESIWAGRAQLPGDLSDAIWSVRSYAKSRADAARAALGGPNV